MNLSFSLIRSHFALEQSPITRNSNSAWGTVGVCVILGEARRNIESVCYMRHSHSDVRVFMKFHKCSWVF